MQPSRVPSRRNRAEGLKRRKPPRYQFEDRSGSPAPAQPERGARLLSVPAKARTPEVVASRDAGPDRRAASLRRLLLASMRSLTRRGQGIMSQISAIIPTYNRAQALRTTLPGILALESVSEIVVVIDGGGDDTAALLSRAADPRIRVVKHSRNRGSQQARMTGVQHARGDWILLLDDDCEFPADYATTLLGEALAQSADIVGAPWFNAPRARAQDLVTQASAEARSTLDLDSHPSTMPAQPVRTPFLPGPALVRRGVFDQVSYDDRYVGNAWREETSFFIDATQAGFTCVLTPATASFQADQWEGGQRRSRLRYEWLVAVNNWRFLCKHGSWLKEQGLISTRVGAQARFLTRRWTRLMVHQLR